MPDRQAIIDIGSNSVRLVVYGHPVRAPAVLFNEKVAAGLGKGLVEGGRLDAGASRQAIRALARFRAIVGAMGVTRIRTVATAAVRDAADGPQFLDRARALGLDVELLSGQHEARGAGLGVISAFPEADGIVGDLGGGSLELVRVQGGAVHQRISLPLGVLRLAALRKGRGTLDRQVRKMIAKSGWKIEPGLPFWLVGGSWRALARLHMHLTDWPLPVLHGYAMPPQAALRLARAVGRMDRKRLKEIESLPSGRIATLSDAAALLVTLTRALDTSSLVVSAYGLREGLLYDKLTPEQRALDPLIEAARQAGRMMGRFPEHGDLLADWTQPLFAHEGPRVARLRHAACLLGDVAWMANPELRAERGVDIALFGNWVGITAPERAVLAHALAVSFGGNTTPSWPITALTSPENCATATLWGLAMRLGQRLSGGVAAPLTASRLTVDATAVTLHLPVDDRVLYGEAVERRLKQLATALGRSAKLG